MNSRAEELRPWLTLRLIPGMGNRSFKALMQRFGSPENILKASERQLREVPLLRSDFIRDILHHLDLKERVETELRLIEKHQVRLITFCEPNYPKNLAQIYDPPFLLYVRGDIKEEDHRAIAIVGTRKPTTYGLGEAEKLAGQLAQRGITVVSGLARGIDTAAHRGALQREGRTIAVLACGVDVAYPEENKELMRQISNQGALVSEYPMSTKPIRTLFPMRNRIISGLSLGVVIVEGSTDSGALITARWATEHNREVFAVPGPVHSPQAKGPHSLIKDGAKLVEQVDDILEELRPQLNLPLFEPQKARVTSPSPPLNSLAVSLTEAEEKVYALLSFEPIHVDALCQKSGLSVSEVLVALTGLELKELARPLAGKQYLRT